MAKTKQHKIAGKGAEWFNNLGKYVRFMLMGAGRWELWKESVIMSLSDFVYIKPNQSWGGPPAVKIFDMLGVQSPLKQPKPASGTTTVQTPQEKEKEDEKNARKNQPTSVNWDHVKSQEYRDKFSGITDNKNVNKTLHKKAVDILKHRQNTELEDMYLIDFQTGKVVATQVNSQTPHMVDYNKAMHQAIKKYPGRLISIHNHPNSMPPSGSDFASNYGRDYKLGVVVAHNGDIYVYNNKDERLSVMHIDQILNDCPSPTWKDEFQKLCKEFKISWKEL